MNIFQVFTVELFAAIAVIIFYAFFNDKFVKVEQVVLGFLRKLVRK